MSIDLATAGRLRKTAVRGLRSLRGTHDETAYLFEKLLTMRQAPPRVRQPAGDREQPDFARADSGTAS